MTEIVTPEKPWWKEMNRYHWLVLAIASMSWLFDCMDQRFFNIVREPAMRSSALRPPGQRTRCPSFDSRAKNNRAVLRPRCHRDDSPRLGGRRVLFRIARRPHRPNKNNDDYHFDLCRLHGPVGTIDCLVGFYCLPLSDGSGRWRTFCRRCVPRCRGNSGPRQTPRPWSSPGAVGSGQCHRLGYKHLPQTAEHTTWNRKLAMDFLGRCPSCTFGHRHPEDPQRTRELAAGENQGIRRPSEAAWRLARPIFTRPSPKYPCRPFTGGGRRHRAVGCRIFLTGTGAGRPQDLPKVTQDKYVGIGLMLQDVGAFFGVYFFTMLAARLGRKPAFGLCFISAFVATACIFQFLRQPSHVFWMPPILGFWTLSVFGGYAIYFPELYPTRLRSSGVGFCYNVGRVITAAALFGSAYLVEMLKGLGVSEPFRVGSILITGIYFLGIIALLWAPKPKAVPCRRTKKFI